MASAVEMIDITKVFPGVVANDKVNLRVEKGEIHALLGENGAGKSTLMSILFGLYPLDGGKILINGKEADIKDPNDAAALGVGMVHQHFKLVQNFTVTENIILGMEGRDRFGNLDVRAAEKRVAELTERYGLAVNPKDTIENITVGMQQRVEILKILYRNADILIFDEPTASLRPQEIDELMDIFKKLRDEGKTILFITHKLKEIKACASVCTVLRRGKSVATVQVADMSEEALAELMVGHAVQFTVDKKPAQIGKTVLKIENLNVANSNSTHKKALPAVQNLNLEIHAGEIVGIAGVDGNGQRELAEAIAGLVPVQSGAIYLDGQDISGNSIRQRIEKGLGWVPEDRHKHGLILPFRLDENFILKSFRKDPYSGKLGFLNFPIIAEHADKLIKDFDIRAGKGPATISAGMSGGNQQKAVIAREIDLSPDLLIVCQPTRGLDVGAIEYIHKRIVAERDKGRAVLLISFELDEIMSLCDRIAAISRGSIVGEVDAASANEREIGAMMGGVKA
ncbi:MAG: ABC transporter ATP-binding protein [Spirochaetaceae bacterium]|jgi:simple sugar transport system ATP-binding protein|nr:ABC transporter ATP-binding protein [Spirochaetaceae bacterium]